MKLLMAANVVGGRKPIKLRCVETGEVATVKQWALKISEARGINASSVLVLLHSKGKRGTAYGLQWERV